MTGRQSCIRQRGCHVAVLVLTVTGLYSQRTVPYEEIHLTGWSSLLRLTQRLGRYNFYCVHYSVCVDSDDHNTPLAGSRFFLNLGWHLARE